MPSPITAAAVLLFCALRRVVRVRKHWLARLAFSLLLFNTGTVWLLQLIPVYAAATWALPLLALVPVIVHVRFRRSWWYIPSMTLALPYLATIAVATSVSKRSTDACVALDGQSGVRRLTPPSPVEEKRRRMRIVLNLADTDDVLVAYRKGFPLATEDQPTLDRFVLDSGRRTSWLPFGEVIALYQDPASSEVFAIVLDEHPDPAGGRSQSDIVRFDPDGRLLQRIPLPGGSWDDYRGNFLPGPNGHVLVAVDGNFWDFEPTRGEVRRAERAASVFLAAQEDRGRLFTTFAHTPLSSLLVPSVGTYDLTSAGGPQPLATRRSILGY